MKTLFLLVSLFSATILYGGIDVQSDSLTGNAIAQTASLDIKGSRYAVLQSLTPTSVPSFWVQNAFGLISLSYPNSSLATRPIGTATVGVSITYEKWENGQFISKSTNTTLSLNLQASSFTNITYLKLPNAHHITITVSSVTIPSGWPSLVLKTSVETNSFNLLSQNAVTPSLAITATPTADSSLMVSWPAVIGAQSYDLEWTYISDQDSSLINSGNNSQSDYYNRLAPSAIQVDPYLFRYNSTRVSVDSLSRSYKIPLIYEQGIIIYRLRAVGQTIVNSTPIPMVTAWTAPDGGIPGGNSNYITVDQYAPNYYKYSGHEQSLNWQYSLSLAEQGKNKAVLSYYDGSSRNRQAVTRINSDQRAIVGETFYDYNGRPVIQLLPVPITANQLLYYPNFNLINGESQLLKSDYDTAQQGNACALLVPKFDTSRGASQYYSSLNPFDSLGGNTGSHLLNRSLIPDAQQYPYTQTLYTPDNTGRIAAQSGVGATHILGSNKETRYIYGVPQQPELSRLFGNQVGYAPHYKKNAVIDANGQTSVSYLNMEGKVVATALAGDNPSNLDTLGDNAIRTISSDLLASSGNISNRLSLDGFSKTYTLSFPVTGANTNYTFNYQGSVGSFNITCDTSLSNRILYPVDGVVDVQLTLNDKCGNNVFNDLKNTQAGNTGSAQNISISEQQTLQPGQYLLSKTLTIDNAQLEAYWSAYLNDTNSCLLTSDQFVAAELARIDVSGCGLTCVTCQHRRDSILNSSNTLTTAQKSDLSHLCDDLCNNADITCLSSLQAMMGDMSPNGQYGQVQLMSISQPAMPSTTIDPHNLPSTTSPVDVTLNPGEDTTSANNNNSIDPSPFPISIFNNRNNLRLDPTLGSPGASWHYPLQVSNSNYTGANATNQILFSGVNMQGSSYSVTDYKNPDGSVFYVNVIGYGTNASNNNLPDSTLPKVTDLTQLILINQASNLYKIPARYLLNFADLNQFWQQNWANYLIPYHPEYQYFINCTSTSQQQNNSFNYTLSNIQTIHDAYGAGFVDSSSGKPIILSACRDTFICSVGAYKGYMLHRDSAYKTVTINNISQNVSMAQMSTISVNCPRLQTNCGMPDCTNGIIDTDDEWNTYKGLYLAEKQILLTDQASKAAVQGLYYNGCIGHSDYITNPDDYYFNQPITNLSPANYYYQKCFPFWCYNVSGQMYVNATSYPYLNPGQVCYELNAPYYANCVQRFYPTVSSGTPGSTPPKNCQITTPSTNPGESGITLNVPCDADLDTALNQVAEAAYSFKYTSCGECPIASDVEQFIMDLRSNSVLFTDTSTSSSGNLLVSCDQDIYPVHLGEVLRNLEIPKTDPANPVIYWNSSVASVSNGTVLTGKLYDGASSIYDTISLWIPSSVTVSFNKLTQLCCLSVNTSGQTNYFPFKANKVFTLQGSYVDNALVQHSFIAEGTTSFPLAPCSFSPNCQLSSDASNAVAFLNTLSINNPSIDVNKQQNLISNSALNLANSSIKSYYNASVINLIRKNIVTLPGQYVVDISSLNPTWQSSVSNDTLTGILTTMFTDSTVLIAANTYKVDTVNTVIEITGLPLSYQYSNITLFNNLRPQVVSSSDVCTTQPCQKTAFLADAIITSVQPTVIVPVTIFVPSLIPVVCTPALPPSNSN